MIFRKACENDIDAIAGIYSDIHTQEEAGRAVIGWDRAVYPTRQTAEQSLKRGDLFVAEAGGKIVGCAIINQQQVDVYAQADWRYAAPDEEVMVLHTLVVSPQAMGEGIGRLFVDFYEKYALEHGCRYLRMDTNEKNTVARALYRKLGYEERGMVDCVFNGLKNVRLVYLEKVSRYERNDSVSKKSVNYSGSDSGSGYVYLADREV